MRHEGWEICHSFESIVVMEVRFCCFHFPLSVTPDDCRWSMKVPSLPLCGFKKDPAPLIYVSLLQEKYCEHNLMRGQNFDISTVKLIHVLIQQRKPHSTSWQPYCSEERKKTEEGHLPLHSSINPMLSEGDSCRQKPVTSCLSQDSSIFASPFVYISELPSDLTHLRHTEIISHHKQADRKHHFPLHCWSLLQGNQGSQWIIFTNKVFSTLHNTGNHYTLNHIHFFH